MPDETGTLARNSFTNGLVMDLEPLVSLTGASFSNTLVNALNATILTSNGNEYALQQDMGNGRVETAYLPEGYIPVGSCEFGDIIYIVSYNPLQNKSQIGCFPSPERNISSDEINDVEQSIGAGDFQIYITTTNEETNEPETHLAGTINATSVKKIVYGNQNMQPGDKYIIYEEDSSNDGALDSNSQKLSDYANTSHKHDTWPKLVKLRVVSIEDSGKIVDLDSSVKWYDNDYYIASLHDDESGQVDLDSYRSIVSSAYSIFQSKVSGKLAILAELETIDGFSCTYDVYTNVVDVERVVTDDKGNPVKDSDGNNVIIKGQDTEYSIYFYTAWETSHNDVNPAGFIFTESRWTADANGGHIYSPEQESNYQIVYNYESDVQPLPVIVPETPEGQEKEYDRNDVIEYTRTYKLEDASNTFDTYINDASYNAQIDDVINWKHWTSIEEVDGEEKEVDHYDALDNDEDRDNVRTVTKVTRLVDEDGKPIEGEYVYNLDIVRNEENPYFTKGNDGEAVTLKPIELNDDVVNNYFHKDIPRSIPTVTYKKNTTFTVKLQDESTEEVTYDNDLSKLVWYYEVAPAMPYGVLDYLAIQGNIDFSKVGSGTIDLTAWRYHNSGTVSTLTWGLEVYPEPNKGVAEVVMDFCDNQGVAASLHYTDKSSYSGTFTESILLGEKNANYKINNIKADGSTYVHAGDADSSGTVYLDENNKATTEDTDDGPYLDDAGTIYANALYLVIITVKYCSKNLLGEYNTDNTTGFKTFYRWYWTNGMFNEFYYNKSDFVNIQPRLTIDFVAAFDTRGYANSDGDFTVNTMAPDNQTYRRTGIFYTDDQDWATLGARVYAINQNCNDDDNGNILLNIDPVYADDFDMFKINNESLNKINVNITLGESSITKSVDDLTILRTGGEAKEWDKNIQPQYVENYDNYDDTKIDRTGYVAYHYGGNDHCVGETLINELGTEYKEYKPLVNNGYNDNGCAGSPEIYGGENAYQEYCDAFSLNFDSATANEDATYDEETGELTYVTNLANTRKYLDGVVDDNRKGVKLTLTGIMFSKIYANDGTVNSDGKVLRSIVHNTDDEANSDSFAANGFYLWKGNVWTVYFSNIVCFCFSKGTSGSGAYAGAAWSHNITEGRLGSTNSGWQGSSEDINADTHLYSSGSNKTAVSFEYTDANLQSRLADGMPDVPIVAVSFCGNSGASSLDSMFSSNSVSDIKNKFSVGTDIAGTQSTFLISKDESVPYGCPSKWVEKRENSPIYNAYLVKDQSTGRYTIIDDYFVSKADDQTRYGSSAADEKCERYTHNALFFASALAQIYTVTDDQVSTLVYSNYIYLQDFSEYWNKKIDVIIDTTSLGEDNSVERQQNVWDAVVIYNQTLGEYCLHILHNTGILDEKTEDIEAASSTVDLTNIYMDLLGIQREIDFQFEVKYDLGDLLREYSNLTSSYNQIYVTTVIKNTNNTTLNSADGPEQKTFTGSVTTGQLYTWSADSETAVPLGSSSMIYLCKYFYGDTNGELYVEYYTDEPLNNAGGQLGKIMGYDNGRITFSGIQSSSTYSITIAHSTDGHKNPLAITGNPGFSIFGIYKI